MCEWESKNDGTGVTTSMRRPLMERVVDPLSPQNSFDDSRDLLTAVTELSDQRPFEARMLDRNGAFHQSRGRWGVRRLCEGIRLRRTRCRGRPQKNAWEDWFYTLSYKNTFTLTVILLATYAAIIIFFAYVYLLVSTLGAKIVETEDGPIRDSYCGMDINNHMEAMYFSLSTMTTIGYGVSDYYFGDCWSPLSLVLLQSVCAITFQSVAIGLLFQRISRGQKRGRTVIFSDKAVVRRVRGVPYLLLRVGELRRHQLIEAKARAYCLRHDRYLARTGQGENEQTTVQTAFYMTKHMTLLHPNEAIDAHLLMSLPQVIVHRLDDASPLTPPKHVWYDADGCAHSPEIRKGGRSKEQENDDMYSYMRDRDAEIVVMVEGTDELTGHALQARHSYRADDIVFDHTFSQCVQPWKGEDQNYAWISSRNCERRRDDPVCSIDFCKFHNVVPAADADYDPYIPSETIPEV